MQKIITRIIPALFFWGIFIFTLLQIPYPQNITQAYLFQLILFFIPLFLAILLTLNIFLKKSLVAGSISLGTILLLILKALDSLNLITASLIVISVGLLISYFKKLKKKDLTKWEKIPKITNLGRK